MAARDDVQVVGVFGSYVRNEQQPDSDLQSGLHGMVGRLIGQGDDEASLLTKVHQAELPARLINP